MNGSFHASPISCGVVMPDVWPGKHLQHPLKYASLKINYTTCPVPKHDGLALNTTQFRHFFSSQGAARKNKRRSIGIANVQLNTLLRGTKKVL